MCVSVCMCVCVCVCVCSTWGKEHDRALVVVWMAVYLTTHSDYLTSLVLVGSCSCIIVVLLMEQVPCFVCACH